ncbi:MAG TPA: hypothetical protein VM901_06160, partial [Bdellovibrionota bacterium]|nr:hypothetical protein [Bdellovibrionota bacterium]
MDITSKSVPEREPNVVRGLSVFMDVVQFGRISRFLQGIRRLFGLSMARRSSRKPRRAKNDAPDNAPEFSSFFKCISFSYSTFKFDLILGLNYLARYQINGDLVNG